MATQVSVGQRCVSTSPSPCPYPGPAHQYLEVVVLHVGRAVVHRLPLDAQNRLDLISIHVFRLKPSPHSARRCWCSHLRPHSPGHAKRRLGEAPMWRVGELGLQQMRGGAHRVTGSSLLAVYLKSRRRRRPCAQWVRRTRRCWLPYRHQIGKYCEQMYW